MITSPTDPLRTARPPVWPALATWAAGWIAMVWLDGRLDLANLAMLLVLTSAVASVWLPGAGSAALGVASVAAFNWAFVPPRGTFTVDLRQHALLLAAMLGVNAIVSLLMLRQRRLADTARDLAEREAALRAWGDTLRDADDPAAHAGSLQGLLAALVPGAPVAVLVRLVPAAPPDGDAQVLRVGQPDADQRAGLALCTHDARALGPGTGRHEQQHDLYLPLRGRGVAMGAAVLCGVGRPLDAASMRHAQALCDTLGAALQRQAAARESRRVQDEAETQAMRNALLAAIAHDYRTPLATIMGAASSLEQQADKLGVAQRRAMAAGIVAESARLSRLTDNTLQLARLDAPGVQLQCDWESAEDLVGAVLGRLRARDPARRLRARLEPGLPLLWCDAMLMSQLLENLADNALKYSPPDAPVELLVRASADSVLLAVRDRGPGIAPAWRERVFEVFHRGAEPAAGPATAAQTAPSPARGAGVGLAVCRAIARAHGGTLTLRGRAHGGCAFECRLPRREPPAPPAEEVAGP